MKHRMKKTLVLALTSALFAGGIPALQASAQVPIRELRQSSGVTISGTVTSIVGNEFVLNDGTGEIIVDAGPIWWHRINLSQGERISVVGELDDYDFDAFRITRSNGEMIQIRTGAGRPPWAGGPNGRNRQKQD